MMTMTMNENSTFEKMTLTDEQRRSVEFNSGDLLVKGAPGSGKSVVIMKRALKFSREAAKNGERKKIVIFTYANSLVKYTDEIMQTAASGQSMITVSTIDSYCLKLLTRMSGRYLTLQKKWDCEANVSCALQRCRRKSGPNRLYDVDTEFWVDEFLWIKQKNINSLEEYMSAERKGRGGKVRITKQDRKLVYSMFTEYCNLLEEKGVGDWEDIYTWLISHSDEIPEEEKFDYVLIDEAQDFTYSKLLTARNLARNHITVAADAAQKIYKTSFTWRELGIDIRGNRSKSLTKPFRSTRQIVELAECLMKVNRESETDTSDYTEPVIPEINGKLPCIFECRDAAEELDTVARLAEKIIKVYPTAAILCRGRQDLKKYASYLASRGIRCQEIRKDSVWSAIDPGIKLSTIHSSKGLEFDAVIIPSFSTGVFPSRQELQGAEDAQKEEITAKERNILYVGMTRAKNRLYMTYIPPVSEFITEMRTCCYEYMTSQGQKLEKPDGPDERAEKEDRTENVSDGEIQPDVEDSTQKSTDWISEGDIIRHPVFGDGIVLGKRTTNGGTNILEVDFEESGIKSFSPDVVEIAKL